MVRAALYMVALSALLILLPASAQAAEIVIVKSSAAVPYAQAEEAIKAELAPHHHTIRSALAKDVSDKGIDASIGGADMVIAVGTPAAAWLQKHLPEKTKLVYCMVSNPEAAGLVQGRQATGVTTDIPPAAQLKLIADALPRARLIGVLHRSDTPDGPRQLKALKEALPEGWKLEAICVNEQPSVAAAIDLLMARNIDVIWTTPDQSIYDTPTVRVLLLAALRSRIPVWGFSQAFVRAGALIGGSVEPAAQGAQAGQIAQRQLTKPDPSARVESPARIETTVNLIVAGQLGIEVPESVIGRAGQVFRSEK